MSLNPQITKIDIGVRELREITIYPLSLRDQFNLTDVMVEAFMKFASSDVEEVQDEAIIGEMISLIEDNIERILKLVCDDEDDVSFDDLTNEQFSDICEAVYEINYEGSSKKILGLVAKIKTRLNLQGPPPDQTPMIGPQENDSP